jgi:hypothetical protein
MIASDAVDRLLDAFGDRDIERIAQCFAVSAQSSSLGANAVVSGRSDIEVMYEHLFKTHPEIAVRVEERMSVGEVVIDHEAITGYCHLPGGSIIHKVYVYVVRDGKILSMLGITTES